MKKIDKNYWLIILITVLSTLLMLNLWNSQRVDNKVGNNIRIDEEVITSIESQNTSVFTEAIVETTIEETTRHLNNYNQNSFDKINLAYQYEQQAKFGTELIHLVHTVDDKVPEVEDYLPYVSKEIADVFRSQTQQMINQKQKRITQNVTFEIQQETPLKIRYVVFSTLNDTKENVTYDITFNGDLTKIIALEQVNE